MERAMSVEDKIKRAEEIYYKRREQAVPQREYNEIRSENNMKPKNIKLLKKMIKQIVLCLVIYSIVYIIVNSNYIFSEDFTNKTKEILNQDIDFKSLYLVMSNNINNVKEQINGLNNKKDETEIQKEETQINEEQNNDSNNSNEENTSTETTNGENGESTENSNNDNIGGANEAGNETNTEISQMEQDANYVKSTINFIKPVNGTVTSGYGWRNPTTATVPKNHTGTDIATEKGRKIQSATDGTVVLASSIGDYGKHLKIQTNDITMVYAHCNALYVKEGDEVKQGQEIAEVGSTGNATGPHLHFEIRYQDRYVDPQLVLDI